MRRTTLALGLALCIGAAGCTEQPHRVPPLTPTWRVASPPGTAVSVTDLAFCAGRWYAVGASGTTTAPSAWTSADGTGWTPVALHVSTPYGHQGSFVSVACRDRDVVAIGRATGGIHGNDRISTWRSQPDGSWTEIVAPFQVFHGQQSGSVDKVVAGPAGWLIVGHRVSPSTNLRGAAVWYSADGVTFQVVDDDPELRATTARYTTALDAAAGPDGWELVGSAGSAIDQAPAAWVSADGLHWRHIPVGVSATGAIERIIPYPRGGVLALGDGGAWARDEPNALRPQGPTCRGEVTGMAAAELFVVAGFGRQLCTSADGRGWREVRPPDPLPGEARLRVATAAGLVAVAGGGRLWLTDSPAATG